jgi:UDP-N-acetyl-2-amino-2-deoxyglucuronate dehydrogenase
MSYNFALIGAAGYVAPRHFKAIKDTGNQLVAILDKSDSVGIIDSYFPEAALFLEAERFDRHLYRLSKNGENHAVQYVSVCSPNYLHDAHIRLALRNNANAICEKPLVLNPWNIDGLFDIEKDTGKKVFHILQLRHHPSVIQLNEMVKNNPIKTKYEIDLTYITGRGQWYYYSWKSNMEKAGGITTNIGSHFLDMLVHIFGKVQQCVVHQSTPSLAAGYLELENARVRWFLSIDSQYIPTSIREKGKATYRSILINNQEFEFSEGFTDLHTLSYQKILKNEGFTLVDAYPYIDLCHQIRTQKPEIQIGEKHPFLVGKQIS